MSIKTVVSLALALLCIAPNAADAGMWGHSAPSCGCEVAAPSCGCEVSCEPSCPPSRCGLLSRLMARRGCCAPAPVCCEPAPVCCEPAPVCCEPAPVCCEPAPVCCDPCADSARCGLLKRLQDRRAARRAVCCPPAPACGCETVAPACGC
jgi:hypothetical protein